MHYAVQQLALHVTIVNELRLGYYCKEKLYFYWVSFSDGLPSYTEYAVINLKYSYVLITLVCMY